MTQGLLGKSRSFIYSFLSSKGNKSTYFIGLFWQIWENSCKALHRSFHILYDHLMMIFSFFDPSSGNRGRSRWYHLNLNVDFQYVHVHAGIFKISNQEGLTVQLRELCSILYNSLNGKRIWKRIDKCITKSLCCTFETNTIINC